MTEEEYVNLKEQIAFTIFNYESKDYIPPHEEDCHNIAEKILGVSILCKKLKM